MIAVGEEKLNLKDVISILYDNTKIELTDTLINKAESNFNFLRDFSKDKVIYGINTGFGPMAQYRIPYADRLVLQYNLIKSHASGSGKPIAEVYSKAMLLDRLNTLAQCKSGVHPDLLLLIKDMLNLGLTPVIYEHGGVGASGDLVQLAHMALAIIGEGEIMYEGKIYPAEKILKKHKLTPFAIRLREGLALMNGTSCMTGIGLVNLIYSKKLLHLSMLSSVTINELFGAFDDHISAELNRVKLHEGQNKVAEIMRGMVADSKLMRNRQEYLYKSTDETHFKEKVQEYYSLRCMPQILGPIYDTLVHTEKILLDELNSVSDNPVVDEEAQNIYHGGNFHGDYVALEMDKLKIAITKLSMLAERQLNYLLNDKLNLKLPPFINTGTIGLNFGIQGIQYTATSTVAENKSLSNPVYVHSIPSNNDNQDIVSMGSNAALMTAKVIENSFEVLSVHMLAIAEAVDALQKSEELSPEPLKLYRGIRALSARLDADVPKYNELRAIKNYLQNSDGQFAFV
jgi:histidine ammonia-lyase